MEHYGALQSSVFPAIDIKRAVESIRRRAVFLGIRLPESIVATIQDMAQEGICRPHGEGCEFRLKEVIDGRFPGGKPAVIASVVGAETAEPVKQVAEDPQILQAIAAYLGYLPKRRHIRLVWSFVTDCGAEARRSASQTIDYHFDVHSFNFVYANYYITPVDAASGAHVMVAGSHRKKPVSWLFGSSRQTEAVVKAHYGSENVLIIEGPSGTGFIQDSSCYHKALPPRTRNRLMLQIRYF
jgi:hypothetical protein